MTRDCLGTIGLPLFSNMKNKQRNLVAIAQMPHFSRFYVLNTAMMHFLKNR